MFDSLKRIQLQRRGLSCGKTRRKQSGSPFLEILRFSPWVKMLAFAGVYLSVAALVTISPAEGVLFEGHPVQALLVLAILFVVALVQFFANHPNSFERNSRVMLIFGLIFFQLVTVKTISSLVANYGLDQNYLFLLVPYALAPVTLSVMLGRTQGVFVAVFSSLWGALLVPVETVFPFLMLGMVVGFVGVYVTNQARKRSRLVRAGLSVGMTALALTVVLGFVQMPEAWAFDAETWRPTGIQALVVLLVGVFTVTLVSGTLPVLESLFGVTTDISWIELADLNHPLLRRLTLEAPGTYHHSLVVANLAEDAAEAIGANATMCRVCSYFHDIGKLVKPGYYIENISEGENPHDDLTPTMSALVISAHVKDGVDLAIKHSLKSEIIDVIEQHHGTSLIYYFYRRALDQREEFKRKVEEGAANPEDIPEVEEKGFRYPGPKPQFRESAIISLADAVESASRSLAKPTPQKIEQLVDEITQLRVREGQLSECDLTFHELDVIKKRFCRQLRSMRHSRVSYPEEDKSYDEVDAARREKTKTRKTAPPQEGATIGRFSVKQGGKSRSSPGGEDPKSKPVAL